MTPSGYRGPTLCGGNGRCQQHASGMRFGGTEGKVQRVVDMIETEEILRLRLRSLLFVPADSEKKIHKALGTPADVVILDLEDAVAPAAKNEARRLACATLRAERSKPIAVRINSAETAWYLEDLAAVASLAPDLIMLPKCSGGRDVARLADQLSVLEMAAGIPVGATAILPLVTETAAALTSLDYRAASPRLCGLAVAGEDLAADLGIEARDASGLNSLLADARRAVAIAAAAAGVAAIDTPFPDPRDQAGLLHEAGQAARLGFAGKMCIHPAQIEAVHASFEPSDARIRWARAVVEAFAMPTADGVTLLDGKMIDRAHLRLARRYLSPCDLPSAA